MLITDVKALMRKAKKESGRKWKDVQAETGRYQSNIIATAYRGKALIESFERILDALGFDVVITVVKKGEKPLRKKGAK